MPVTQEAGVKAAVSCIAQSGIDSCYTCADAEEVKGLGSKAGDRCNPRLCPAPELPPFGCTGIEALALLLILI